MFRRTGKSFMALREVVCPSHQDRLYPFWPCKLALRLRRRHPFFCFGGKRYSRPGAARLNVGALRGIELMSTSTEQP